MQSSSDISTDLPRYAVDAARVSLEPGLAALASRQHGVVTLAQLRDLGMSRSAVRPRLVKGHWVAAGPSVLRVDGSPSTWESDLMAQVLGAGSEAVASHRAAAALWGLEGFSGCRPEITVPRSRSSSRSATAVIHRSSDLHVIRPVARSGIPTTPLGRTILDLAAVVGPATVEQAIEDARGMGLIDWDGLVNTLVVHARRGRDGIGLLRSILDRSLPSGPGGRTRSRLACPGLERSAGAD